MSHVRLGVNIDHVATLRQARKVVYPDPVQAAKICEKWGADGIVCHLREDRRHIHEKDVQRLLETLKKPLNLEMSMAPEIVKIALRLRPSKITLVPERRQELTTEGGLDVKKYLQKLKKLLGNFLEKGIGVSLFIDPEIKQLEAALQAGVPSVEFHTGAYANASSTLRRRREFYKLKKLSREARAMGFEVAAGHGLHYTNTQKIAGLPQVEELNIGHSIVSEAVFIGLGPAVRKMRKLIG